MSSLDNLQRALDSVEGATPKEVIDAFLPKKKEIAGRSLVPLTLGHSIFLANCDHPLSRGELENWKPHETALALFAFTRGSGELKDEVANGTLEQSLDDFMKEIPLGSVLAFTAILMAHYIESLQTGVEMHDPNAKGKAQKKTLLDGFCQRLRDFVANIIGRLISFFTNSR